MIEITDEEYELFQKLKKIWIHSSPTEFHRCVSVEQINYTPINIEELSVR